MRKLRKNMTVPLVSDPLNYPPKTGVEILIFASNIMTGLNVLEDIEVLRNRQSF
jgi:hypothetical protein